MKKTPTIVHGWEMVNAVWGKVKIQNVSNTHLSLHLVFYNLSLSFKMITHPYSKTKEAKQNSPSLQTKPEKPSTLNPHWTHFPKGTAHVPLVHCRVLYTCTCTSTPFWCIRSTQKIFLKGIYLLSGNLHKS